MIKQLGISDIRNWIKTLKYTTPDKHYIGKIDNKQEQSIGVYQLKTSKEANVAVGGIDNTKTLEKSVAILIHWTTNAKETEQISQEIYDKLLRAKGFKIKDKKVNYIKLLTAEPIDIGTDGKNIYERVIQATFYYEKKEE